MAPEEWEGGWNVVKYRKKMNRGKKEAAEGMGWGESEDEEQKQSAPHSFSSWSLRVKMSPDTSAAGCGRLGDGEAKPTSLGFPSFPSNQKQVSTVGWTAPDWAGHSLLDPSVRCWV